MDRVKDYIEKLNIKSVVVGGFDKESVFVCLKELVALFEEELENVQKENLELQNKLQDLNQTTVVQKNANNEIFNEMNKLQKYASAYQELKKQLDELEKEKYNQFTLNKQIKEESQKEIIQLKKQIQELSSQSHHKDIISLDYIKDHFNQAIDQLSTAFIEQNEDILLENKKLKEENESLKSLVDKYQKTQMESQQHFVDEINQLYNKLDLLKNKYLKDD